MKGCGENVAYQLAKTGLGDTLLKAARDMTPKQLRKFLDGLCNLQSGLPKWSRSHIPAPKLARAELRTLDLIKAVQAGNVISAILLARFSAALRCCKVQVCWDAVGRRQQV